MKRRSVRHGLALAACLLASGCASTASDCPPLAPYTAAEQDQAAYELERLLDPYGRPRLLEYPPGSGRRVPMILPRMLDDYARLRAMVRACEG